MDNQFNLEKAAVIREQAQRQPQQQPGLIDRMRTAFSQGYEAGSGNNYSLAGLTQPQTQAKDLYTYPLYEKTGALQKKTDSYISGATSYLPGGIGDFVGGVGKGASGLVYSLGYIPMGLESMVRNPKSSPETVSLGLGTMAGATVTKAKTNPLELGGEIVGAYGISKASGSVFAKMSPKQIREVPITETERQFSILEGVEKTKIDTLGSSREYLKLKTRVAGENELNPFDIQNSNNVLSQDVRTFNVKYTKTRSATDFQLNTEIKSIEGTGQIRLSRPNIINGEQKTLTGETIVKVDKSKWVADFSGLPEINKFTGKKQYSIENYPGVGKDSPDYDFSTVVENTRARAIGEVKPKKEPNINSLSNVEGANLYFDVPKTPKQSTIFYDFSGNSNIVIHTPGARQQFYSSLKNLATDETGTLFSKYEPIPEAIQQPKIIPGRPKTELDYWKRDIILEELQPKISTKIETFEVPNTYSSLWGWGGAGLSLASQPFTIQIREPTTYNPTKGGIWAVNAPKIDIQNDITTKSGIGLKTRVDPFISQDIRIDLIPDIRNDVIPDIKPDVIPAIRNDVIPDIKPDIIPDIPDVIPDIKPDYIPDTKPDIVPTTNPFFYNPDIPFPVGGGAWDFYRALNDSTVYRKRARNKTLKNVYGDPFKLKIKVKL